MVDHAPRTYGYVGPLEILKQSQSQSAGTTIADRSQLISWINANRELGNSLETVTATFVISLEGYLKLSPRRSEHIACAGGKPVLSAGEVTISSSGEILEVSNYSTGFCPEPSSWDACASAFQRISVPTPGNFTQVVVFRKCPNCLQRNIVKDDWYFCDVCGTELPRNWNFA